MRKVLAGRTGRLVYAAYLLLLAALTELGVKGIGLDLLLMPKLLFYQTALPGLHEPDPDPERLYRLRPNAQDRAADLVFRTNSLGFRGPERGAAKPAGVVRVVCLGGSNTFGAKVNDDQTYPAFLESALNARFRGRFEVWNAGLSAAVMRQNVAQAEDILARYDPDVLIFQSLNAGRRAFLPGQDFGPAFREDPELWLENLRFVPFASRAWGRALLRGSALWRVLVVGLNHVQAFPANNTAYASDEPNRRKFMEFWRRRHTRLPIVVMDNSGSEPAWPDGVAVLRLFDRKALPAVPYREYLFIHPPACAYRWYAAVIARHLAEALPATFRPIPGPLPRGETCRAEGRGRSGGRSSVMVGELRSENERARGLLAAWARQSGSDAGLSAAYADAAAACLRPAENPRPSPSKAAGPGLELRHRAALDRQRLQDYPAALALLEGLIRQEPGAARYWKDLGVSRYLSGDAVRAVQDLEQALALDPSLLSAALSLGAIHKKEGRPGQALAVYDRALRIKSRGAEAAQRPQLQAARDELARSLSRPSPR